MSTFATLKARVADELNKSNLTSQVATAVTRAIEFYADERLEFNEGRSTCTTTASNDYVTYPSGLRKADEVFATVSGRTYKLIRRDFDVLEYWHGASDSTGQPMDYAIRDGQLFIYPTPDQAYTLTVTGVYDETALSDDTDTNGWCTGMPQDLIVARAKFTIARDITIDDEMMRNSRLAEVEALARLRSETRRKISSRKVRPGW